ncbi:unnamed protein product, partial [Mesorhabditis spiculigera]
MIGMMNNPSNSVEFYSARRGSQEAEVEFVEGPKKSHVQYAADGRKIIDGKVVPEPAGRLWTRTLLSGAINHAMGTGSNPEVVDDEELVLPVALLICLASKIGAQDTTCTDRFSLNALRSRRGKQLHYHNGRKLAGLVGVVDLLGDVRRVWLSDTDEELLDYESGLYLFGVCDAWLQYPDNFSEATMVETCNLAVCRYPAAFACCLGQPGQYRGSFACLEANTTTTTAPAG